MNNIKQKILYLIIIIGILMINNSLFAQDLCGEYVWMGWANNQYGNMSYGAVADYSINDEKLQVKGYGRYQYYYKTNLIDFLSFLDADYFKRYIEFGLGSDKLNDYTYGLQIAFTDYFNDFKDKMIEKQDKFLYEKYYLELKNRLKDNGINLNEHNEYLKGACLSYLMYNLDKNEILQSVNNEIVRKLSDFYSSDDKEYITNIYDYLIEINSANKNIRDRFVKEKRACLEEQDDDFDSKIGELLNIGGTSNSLTSIREINESNPEIFNTFLTNGKFFTESNLSWYDSVRHSVDYSQFGISSGVLDFGISTSKGYNVDGYLSLINNEVAFKKPNTNYNVFYIPQNYFGNDKDYSNVNFGANNIAQGGGSLACLSMCINKFLDNNESNLILPNDIVDIIKENHDGDYNFYYNTEKKGQNNEIIADVCSYYNLSSNQISGSSISSSLANGLLVIARVQESEFTKWGNFVLIVGSEVIDGVQMYCVYDPNIYHANYIYKLYDLNYLINDCKGIFFEIS